VQHKLCQRQADPGPFMRTPVRNDAVEALGGVAALAQERHFVDDFKHRTITGSVQSNGDAPAK
jgi:hypothetical protein